jgi:hypothetical protein
MNPFTAQLAAERIRDVHTAAARHRLAREMRGTRYSGRRRPR